MKRLLLLILLLLICPAWALAQVNTQRVIFTSSNPPTSCVAGKVYTNPALSPAKAWVGTSASACTPIDPVSAGVATKALDNLASVNINTSLLAQTGVDLGSTTKPFRDLFLFGSGTYGTTYFRFTGTPTGTRTLTIPNETGTLCTTGSICSGYQASLGFTAENSANKDASGGYVGLTLFKINFKNAANTFTSFFTNSNTAARTYTFQDRNGTIADDTDLAAKQNTITFGANVLTALGVAVGTDGAFVVKGGALGSPSSVGTLPAFTLGGTITGGSQTVNSLGPVGIGVNAPAAGFGVKTTAARQATFYGFTVAGASARDDSGTVQIGNTDSDAGRLDYNGAGNTTFSIDNTFDSTAALVQIRTRTAGTPVSNMLWLGTGNTKIAGSAVRGTTEGTNHFDIFDGTAPAGTLANGISLYSTSGELRVMDSGGTATLLSSHSRITGEWIHDSYSAIQKKRLTVQTEQMSKFIDSVFGTHFVQEVYDDPEDAPAPLTAPMFDRIGGTQVLTPTPGATVTLTIDTTAKHVVASWTSGEAETINVSGTPQDGARLTLVITNDGVLGRLLTPGTGLSALSTILNIVSKKTTVSFVALNGTFYEVSRTVGF